MPRPDAPDDETPGTYASPPCFMHELDPAYAGLAPAGDARDVLRWRKAARERLISERLAIPAAVRADHAGAIGRGLGAILGDVSGQVVSLYWPFRGEPDLRGWMETLTKRGAVTALPVVVEKARPLVFRAWKKGEPLERGVWNIPVPAEGREVEPDIVIAPLVGFDPGCYRLGYGGGFDRTLAALGNRPLAIGVGYEAARLASIYPLPHDIPMQAIVTEARAAL